MADFPEFILFALICAVMATLAVLGGVAFWRTSRLRDALALAEERIRYLEDALQELAATGVAPAARPTPVVSPAPAAAPRAAPARKAPRLANIEKAIASNWFVWIGGAFIALAIIFTLRLAIDEGWFKPPAQLAGAYLLGAALFSAGEYMRRRPPADASTQLRHLPAILAAAGLFAIFAATYAGHATFHLLTAGFAFVILALCALAAIMLALRYGPWLAALGLGGGYLAPALVRFEDPSPAALFGYVLALTAATLAVIKLRRWRGFVWLVAGGALAWGAVWLLHASPDDDFGGAAFYMVALAALGIVFAWNETMPLPAVTELRNWRALWSESTLAAHALVAASALVLLCTSAVSASMLVSAAIIALCAMTAIIASVREGFSLAPLCAAVLGVGAILFWRVASPGAPLNVQALIFTAGALGFVFSGGGWLMMARSYQPGYGATLAALGPISVVAATHEAAPFLRESWAVAALALAFLNSGAAYLLARGRPVEERANGHIAAFTLGAAAAISFAIYFGLKDAGLWLSAALAILIPFCAYLDLRFKTPSLRIAIAALAAIVTWRLILGLEPLRYGVSATPIFNQLIPGYAFPALCLWGAGWLYRRGGLPATSRLVETLEIAALVIAVAGLSWEARHIANRGDVAAPTLSLLEAGEHATAWLALALGLAARFGPKPRRAIFYAETAFAAAAGLWVLLLGGLVLNPWWGEQPAPIPGWPIFNPLLAAYGAPAALLAIYAILKRRQGLAMRGAIAGAAATIFAFLNVTLEVRRAFQGPGMALGAIGSVEAWAYTAVWVAFAGALLALGLMRHKPSLRYASLAVLLAAIIKAFGFDMSALTGVLRALSYLGLGIAVIAVALVYQRYVFPRALKESSP
ncbi:MAG TPA: DUF2339 domain-containing protein [Caulobacterales bacterium]|nr:DUF2339 domain-containing protein [Caulobacterales bacterium]